MGHKQQLVPLFFWRGFVVFVQGYKYMRIYLWTALRIRDLRMMDLRINGF